MVKRVCLQVAVLVAGAAFIAGCGSSSSTSGAPATPRGATTGSVATSTTPVASGGTTSTDVELSTCSSTAARSRLSTSGKAKYLLLCKQAVDGSGASIKRVAARECQQIIKQTVPAAAQAALIAGCPKA
jgi:hypothetical protein